MLTPDKQIPWKPWQKIAFRFLFLFLGFFLLDYELTFVMIDFVSYKLLGKIYGYTSGPLHWLDQHFYHIGYDPKLHDSVPGDNHFGIVFYLTLIIIFLTAVIVWSIIDRRRKEYDRLNYWFRIYIRYMLALVVFDYGIGKLIPAQMSYPDVTELLMPFGEKNLFSVVWNFIGASPGYERFTGVCEIVACSLLVFRRTYVFGSLLMCGILCNIVALNIFYNISVKIYSSLLLVSTLYLVAPFVSRLVQFFMLEKSVSLTEKRYTLQSNFKKYLVRGLLVCIPLASFLGDTFVINKVYNQVRNDLRSQKLYEVVYFIAKDTLQPILTDTLRWKRFAFTSRKSVAVYSMQDKSDFFDCDWDSVKHTYRLHDNGDSTKWDLFHYSYQPNNLFQLTGTWKENHVNIVMKEDPIDSISLHKERLILIQD